MSTHTCMRTGCPVSLIIIMPKQVQVEKELLWFTNVHLRSIASAAKNAGAAAVNKNKTINKQTIFRVL
jgi:hypothetical protein